MPNILLILNTSTSSFSMNHTFLSRPVHIRTHYLHFHSARTRSLAHAYSSCAHMVRPLSYLCEQPRSGGCPPLRCLSS